MPNKSQEEGEQALTQDTQRTRKPLIVGLGEVLWDMLPGGKMLGGAPANFAHHAQQLGAESAVVAGVGPDALGAEIKERFQPLGLDAQYLRTVDYPTGTVDVALGADGQPTYAIREEVAWDYLPFDDALQNLAGRADAVCWGSLAQRSGVSRQSIQAFVGGARRGCLKIFDVNLRPPFYDAETIQVSLHLADALKLNHEELPRLAAIMNMHVSLGLKSEQELDVVPDAVLVMSLLNLFDLRMVALTRGANGSALYTPHRVSELPGLPVNVVDTIGAGDAFTAALAMGLLRVEDLDRLHDRASRLSAWVCSQPGGTPPINAEQFP